MDEQLPEADGPNWRPSSGSVRDARPQGTKPHPRHAQVGGRDGEVCLSQRHLFGSRDYAQENGRRPVRSSHASQVSTMTVSELCAPLLMAPATLWLVIFMGANFREKSRCISLQN